MRERERLIGELEAVRAEMHAVLALVDRGREIYPGWTIKQVLAHIAGWDDAVNASLRAHLGCEEFATPAAAGIDPYNAELVATRERLSYDQVVAEWELARRELIALVREIPEGRWEETHLYAWGERGTVSQELAIFIHHEREHADEIRDLLS